MNTPTDLSAMACVSSAVRPFSDDELDALLVDARAFKNSVRVTGVLLLPCNPSALHKGQGPGTPGCGQAHPLALASVKHHGGAWKLRLAKGSG